jgi:hypothetical protein
MFIGNNELIPHGCLRGTEIQKFSMPKLLKKKRRGTINKLKNEGDGEVAGKLLKILYC